MDWDAAYSNSDHVAGSAEFVPRWSEASRIFREAKGPRARIGISYGPSARQCLDLFMPEGDPRGLAIFVHGGYWHRNVRDITSHLATGTLAHGWAFAVPGYDLCPQVRVSEITGQIRAAIAKAAELVPGPIHLAGHSAGGHLVTRMACQDANLPDDVTQRLGRIAPISGVHDLRPLMQTSMNDTLHLDLTEASAESPALAMPRDGVDMLCWVGGAELPEFLRQNALLSNIWRGFGARMAAHEAPGKHHFSVIEDLEDPDSLLVRTWLKG